MSTDPLEIVQQRIERRIADHRETALMATAHVVNAMTARQAAIVYALLVDRPLLVADADLAQLTAQRIGATPNWWHVDLIPGAEWMPGRKEVGG